MTRLFEPLTLRGNTFANRIWLAPMCQYSAIDGLPNDWHLMHLGSHALGGYGLLLTEATAVVPEGRISPQDTGLWNDAQQQAWSRIVDFVHDRDTPIGIQLSHAGRKSATFRPWEADHGTVPASQGGWQPAAPSAIAYPGYGTPTELTVEEIAEVVRAFGAAAVRADSAGFDVIEIHAAHGYLLHQFLSPLSNQRTDGYGGTLAGRARLLLEVVSEVRAHWPERKPVFVRFSGTDWSEGGWTVQETAEVSAWVVDRGVDLVDISSGGLVPAVIPVGPGYQVPLARTVREITAAPTGAVGLITEPQQAEQILAEGSADVVFLARAALRDPMWPRRAAHELGVDPKTVPFPPQYERAAW